MPGLPSGHRGVFWLSALIASRWVIDRPGTAVRVAAASSSLILVINPATGGQVVPYLVAALLVDLAAAAPAIRRHPWLLLPLAPLIQLTGVLSPLVHNLGISPLGTVLSGMWFYIQGHLLWGGRGSGRARAGDSRPQADAPHRPSRALTRPAQPARDLPGRVRRLRPSHLPRNPQSSSSG